MTKGLTEILTSGSESFRRANQHLVAGQVLPVDPYQAKGDPYAIAPERKEGAKRRLRQSSATLNKTEQRFFDWHLANFPDRLLFAQAITLKIANGCRYTPDFVAVRELIWPDIGNQLAAYEVKGPFARDDAIVKLKVAASVFPFIAFTLVTWNRAEGVWDMESVRP